MTRLANMEKAGYYPLPPSITNLIISHFITPHDGRILDPEASERTALITLAEKLGLEPLGIELHEGRVNAAREAINQLMAENGGDAVSTRILHDSYLNLITSQGGYNLLYLNPPYEHDDEDGRLEYCWLVRTCPCFIRYSINA